jgi:hypothetical protein
MIARRDKEAGLAFLNRFAETADVSRHTTGKPAAIYSSTAFAKPSARELKTPMSDANSNSATRSQRPMKNTSSAIPSSAANSRNIGSNSPSPAMTNAASGIARRTSAAERRNIG